MFQEMENTLNNLMVITNREDHLKNDTIIYLACELIEKNYLLLITTPTNLKTLDLIKEEFPEVNYIADFDKQQFKKRLYLYEELKKWLYSDSSVDDFIDLLRNYCIIIKKDDGLDVLLDTFEVQKILGGKTATMHKMRVLQSGVEPNRYLKDSREALQVYLNDNFRDRYTFEKIAFDGDFVRLNLEASFKLNFDEVMLITDIKQEKSDVHVKEIKRLVTSKRKIIKEELNRHPLLKELRGRFKHRSNGNVYLIEDWFKELKQEYGELYPEEVNRYRHSFIFLTSHISIIDTPYPEHADDFTTRLDFYKIKIDDFSEIMFNYFKQLNNNIESEEEIV